jgi:lipopolysaccharide/colanic/teichoic acid biosynthesis glycosyltransferase
MYNFFKRIADLLASFIAIVVLIPIFLIIVIALRFTAEGEVFYTQERIGYLNSKFEIWKFATMFKNSLNLGTGSITLNDDFRVTKIGKFLRKSKINELPQLFNILIGDISVVGPRPILESDWNLYSEEIKNMVYNVKPGLTGIGSIVFRDEESIMSSVKNEDLHLYYERVVAPYKGELEKWYQLNRSFIVDTKLIILTALVIIYPSNNLHEKWFKGLPKKTYNKKNIK